MEDTLLTKNPINTVDKQQLFLTNLLFSKLQESFIINREDNKKHFNDFVEEQNTEVNLFYLPRRRLYCRANWMHSVMNKPELFFADKLLFMDSKNKSPLKRKLKKFFDFLNTLVHRNFEQFNRE